MAGTGITLDYDGDANLISATGGLNLTLTYDDENRLVSYTDNAANTTTTFAYDPDGQRTRKTVQTSGVMTTTYYAGNVAESVVNAATNQIVSTLRCWPSV